MKTLREYWENIKSHLKHMRKLVLLGSLGLILFQLSGCATAKVNHCPIAVIRLDNKGNF